MKKFTLVLSIALQVLAGNIIAHAQRIAVTVAGNGTAGYTGNNGPGRAAAINGPIDVCMDGAQNLYFTDQASGLVQRLSMTTGVITTVAGGSTSLADGVPATSASLVPNYLCINAGGYILYVTTMANEIKKINLATGIITTVAGNGTAGYGGDGGPAAGATLNSPEGICTDAAGNIYFADRWNARIRVINGATGTITTFAGNGVPSYDPVSVPATACALQSPIAVCLNASGDLFISDQEPDYPAAGSYLDHAVIKKVTAATGLIADFAGAPAGSGSGLTSGIPLLTAFLGEVTGMCADPAGDIYCNEMSCSCREANITTDTLDLIAGNFYSESFSDDTTSASALMNFPMGLCMDHAGNIYIADSANNRIRKLIPLSHTPTFAFGPGQYIDPAATTTAPIDSLLWITDIDSGQAETWTVITPPALGTLAGFPATTLSNGTTTTTKPAGLSYTPLSSYSDSDRFQVRVSDGLLADTITIYVGAGSLPHISFSTSVNTIASAAPVINIFPNPATSVLNIKWTNMPAGNASVVISDVAGRLIYNTAITGNSNSGTMQTDISGIPAGLYFVKVNGSEVRKFVKE